MYRAIRDGVKEMLSYALAIAVALSSLVLFSTAFLMSDIHRQDDFLWSGVGLFYALVLWFCARNITGAVLLGQTAAATLLVSYNWQTLKLRKAVANPERATAIANFSLLKAANSVLNRKKIKSQSETIASKVAAPEKVTDKAVEIPKNVSSTNSGKNSDKTKSGRFGRFFGKQKKSNITNTKLDEILEGDIAAETPANRDNKTTKSPSVNMPKVVESSASEKVKPTQIAEKNVSDAIISSVVSEQVTQSAKKPVETSELPAKGNSNVSKVAEDKPIINSVSSVIQSESKLKKESITVESGVAKKIPKSPVIKESKPYPSSQEVSEVEDSQIEKNNPTELKSESQTENISINSPDTPKPSIKVVKPSVLDSLETIEVAEVLEALPEDGANNRDQEQENIIEVTTTEIKEINIATEVAKIDHNQNED